MKLSDIYWYLRNDINKIDKEIEFHIGADHPILKHASSQLLKAGGKRIRPVFVLLSAQLGDYNFEKVKNIAIPLELIHMGSLVHDDVIDDADTRRGRKTIKAEWDNRVAMYTGDYLFAKAVELAAKSDFPRLHTILSKAILEMCLGEIEQLKDQYAWPQSKRNYFKRIKRKTALLISVSCQLGALTSNASREVEQKIKMYGYYVGMAYQITDDLLDFVGTEKMLGKPAGGDLLQGNVTFPALIAMERNVELKHQIVDYLDANGEVPFDISEVINKIVDTGAIEESKRIADLYIKKALHEIEDFPESRTKKAFKDIASFIGERNF